MRIRRPWSAAVAVLAAALVVAPTAGATPGPDPERDPQRSTGLPAPAAPVPQTLPGLGGTSAAAVSDATVRRRLQTRSEALVPTLGGYVADVGSGRTVWSRGGPVGLRPASATKVLTATSALQVFGADHRFVTVVKQAQSRKDYIYLVGGGDPTLTSTRLGGLANSTASSLEEQGIGTVTLRVDDSLFPAPSDATGWEDDDVPKWVAPVRALVVDQENSMDTSMQAANVYARALRAKGIRVRSVSRMKSPRTAQQIAYRYSPVLGTIVADMLRESQNDYAEALLWTSGLAAGGSRSWRAMSWRVTTQMRRYGIPMSGMRIYDGSGLSRANRISARSLTTLMTKLYQDPQLRPVFFADRALPVAGRTGTLDNRFATSPSSCAAGRVRAKTGSLRDTTVLTGIAYGRDGRTRAFAFLSSGRANTSSVRTRLDELAATAVTCM